MLVIFLLFQIFAFDVHVRHSGIQAGFEGKVCISYGQADIRKKKDRLLNMKSLFSGLQQKQPN